MIGIWPPVPDLLEDHAPSLREAGPRCPPLRSRRRAASQQTFPA
jgi:hypothetical protein